MQQLQQVKNIFWLPSFSVSLKYSCLSLVLIIIAKTSREELQCILQRKLLINVHKCFFMTQHCRIFHISMSLLRCSLMEVS